MFEDDKNFGEEMQKEFCKILIRRGYEIAHVAEGNFPDWDIQITSGKTFEVKADKKTGETGNIFIETRYRGEPSGICATKADYFVVIASNFAHIALSEDVRRFLLFSEDKAYIRKAGDNGMSSGYIIKSELYKPKNMRLYEIGF